MSDDIKDILKHLISTPLENEIQIDVDLSKKKFILSFLVFATENSVPLCVKTYVEARKNRFFKPYATSFVMEGDRKVKLVQEIPFCWGLYPDSRKDILDFFNLAKCCYQMFYEIALEEKYKEAMNLDIA